MFARDAIKKIWLRKQMSDCFLFLKMCYEQERWEQSTGEGRERRNGSGTQGQARASSRGSLSSSTRLTPSTMEARAWHRRRVGRGRWSVGRGRRGRSVQSPSKKTFSWTRVPQWKRARRSERGCGVAVSVGRHSAANGWWELLGDLQTNIFFSKKRNFTKQNFNSFS